MNIHNIIEKLALGGFMLMLLCAAIFLSMNIYKYIFYYTNPTEQSLVRIAESLEKLTKDL